MRRSFIYTFVKEISRDVGSKAGKTRSLLSMYLLACILTWMTRMAESRY